MKPKFFNKNQLLDSCSPYFKFEDKFVFTLYNFVKDVILKVVKPRKIIIGKFGSNRVKFKIFQ